MKKRIGICVLAAALLGLGGGCAWLNEPCNCGFNRTAPLPVRVETEAQPV